MRDFWEHPKPPPHQRTNYHPPHTWENINISELFTLSSLTCHNLRGLVSPCGASLSPLYVGELLIGSESSGIVHNLWVHRSFRIKLVWLNIPCIQVVFLYLKKLFFDKNCIYHSLLNTPTNLNLGQQ